MGRGRGLLQILSEHSLGYYKIRHSNLASGGPHYLSNLCPSQCPILFSQSHSFSLVINHANDFLSTVSIVMLVPSVQYLNFPWCCRLQIWPQFSTLPECLLFARWLPIKASFSERLVYINRDKSISHLEFGLACDLLWANRMWQKWPCVILKH